MSDPRSVRNNNPGNILRNNIAWDGLQAPDQMTPDQQAEDKFLSLRRRNGVSARWHST